MKTKHTAGPWKAWGKGSAITDANGAGVVFPDANGRFGSGERFSDAEDEANARLIAAAPELLETARVALERIERLPGTGPKEHCDKRA